VFIEVIGDVIEFLRTKEHLAFAVKNEFLKIVGNISVAQKYFVFSEILALISSASLKKLSIALRLVNTTKGNSSIRIRWRLNSFSVNPST